MNTYCNGPPGGWISQIQGERNGPSSGTFNLNRAYCDTFRKGYATWLDCRESICQIFLFPYIRDF